MWLARMQPEAHLCIARDEQAAGPFQVIGSIMLASMLIGMGRQVKVSPILTALPPTPHPWPCPAACAPQHFSDMHAASCDCGGAIAVLDPCYTCFPMDLVLKLVLQKRTSHIAQCTTCQCCVPTTINQNSLPDQPPVPVCQAQVVFARLIVLPDAMHRTQHFPPRLYTRCGRCAFLTPM